MLAKKVGFIGWRGMVGSVLLSRMQESGDFDNSQWQPYFFSTSQVGQPGPTISNIASPPLLDAYNLDDLQNMDIIISCQGGDYTKAIHPQLRDQQPNGRHWNGYWIDAASPLRMAEDSLIVLDPVNGDKIMQGIDDGIKDFIGGNCTVSLSLMAIAGLVKADLVEWVSAMTYQAISGAGAQSMRELIKQMQTLGNLPNLNLDHNFPITELDRIVLQASKSSDFPTDSIGYPLAGSLLPWIDSEMPNGQSREEWKGQCEINKIMGLPADTIKVDGSCVRISSMRCHSQGLTIKLKENIPVDEIERLLADSSDWVKVIANEKSATLSQLTPTAVSGTLNIAIGRLRKMTLGEQYLSAFTVGDQLLWGAAEPLRRMLQILLQKNIDYKNNLST